MLVSYVSGLVHWSVTTNFGWVSADSEGAMALMCDQTEKTVFKWKVSSTKRDASDKIDDHSSEQTEKSFFLFFLETEVCYVKNGLC